MSNNRPPGPSYSQMEDPSRLPEALRKQVAEADELDPIRLYGIHWRPEGELSGVLLPSELTGVDAPIVLLSGAHFPTGSHKVGPVYAILAEKQIAGEVDPEQSTAVWPSTGNYGIGGAWVGPRMGYRSLVVLPEGMSRERFERIERYGGSVIATPGTESNVKEIFDKVKELRKDPGNVILNQFAEFGNYRFHYRVTGTAVLELAAQLGEQGVGNGQVAAVVSAMGSAGTIAAGDRVKQANPSAAIVGVEPLQCPTLYDVGFGEHGIEGIGDKHVTWIHNVLNMDLLTLVDDRDCLRGLQLLEQGREVLAESGISETVSGRWAGRFGISAVCNIIGAIKAVRTLGLTSSDLVVTFATDAFDRYPSVMDRLTEQEGPMDRDVALRRLEAFHCIRADNVLEGTRDVRRRWHNQKYFTWVEQQGMAVEELREQTDPAFWLAHQARIAEIDKQLEALQ